MAGQEDLMQAAEQVWGALDKMAAQSPEEYQKFIREQLKEGEEVMAGPEPVFCLRCPLHRVNLTHLPSHVPPLKIQ